MLLLRASHRRGLWGGCGGWRRCRRRRRSWCRRWHRRRCRCRRRLGALKRNGNWCRVVKINFNNPPIREVDRCRAAGTGRHKAPWWRPCRPVRHINPPHAAPVARQAAAPQTVMQAPAHAQHPRRGEAGLQFFFYPLCANAGVPQLPATGGAGLGRWGQCGTTIVAQQAVFFFVIHHRHTAHAGSDRAVRSGSGGGGKCRGLERLS